MKDIIHSEKIIEPTIHKTGITGASTRENSGLEQREDKQLPIESQGLLVDTHHSKKHHNDNNKGSLVPVVKMNSWQLMI
jgi:hypothetical protein